MDMVSLAVHFHQFRFKVRADLGKDASEHFDSLAVKDSFAVFGQKDQMHMEHENAMSAVPNIVDFGHRPEYRFALEAKSMQISDLANPWRERQGSKARTAGGRYIPSAAVVDNLPDAARRRYCGLVHHLSRRRDERSPSGSFGFFNRSGNEGRPLL